jgi:hypothetical protein
VPELNANTPRGTAALAAQIALRRQHIPRAIAVKVVELTDGGLSTFEIASITGLPIPMVNLILRGAPPGVIK